METVTIILLIVAVLKIVSVSNAIRWLGRSGNLYACLIRRDPPQTETAYCEAFEKSEGNYFPFGIKD
jgi:transposase